MSSIGVLTFSDAINYGGVLQLVALSHSLRRLGFEAQVIDYRRDVSRMASNDLIARARRATYARTSEALGLSVRRSRTDEFRRSAVTMTPMTYTHDTIGVDPPVFDAYLVGSDQVWNLEHTGWDTRFLLDFVPGTSRRLSYAPSFGHDAVSPRAAEILAHHLGAFDALSAREASGIEIIREATGRTAKRVLDPTLLLTKEDWLRQAGGEVPASPGLVLEYVMPGHRRSEVSMRRLSERVATESESPLVIIGDRPHRRILPHGKRHDAKAGPREFLSYLDQASVVVTNSFHGTALAILFEKPFFSLYRKPRHEASARSGRQISLLESVGLTSRGFFVEEIEGSEAMVAGDRAVDFGEARCLLTELREESIRYLRQSLSLT